MASRRSHLGIVTWPDEYVPSVPMEVIVTSSVALAKVDAARASSSAVVFVRRRKDLMPESFRDSMPVWAESNAGDYPAEARRRRGRICRDGAAAPFQTWAFGSLGP